MEELKGLQKIVSAQQPKWLGKKINWFLQHGKLYWLTKPTHNGLLQHWKIPWTVQNMFKAQGFLQHRTQEIPNGLTTLFGMLLVAVLRILNCLACWSFSLENNNKSSKKYGTGGSTCGSFLSPRQWFENGSEANREDERIKTIKLEKITTKRGKEDERRKGEN